MKEQPGGLGRVKIAGRTYDLVTQEGVYRDLYLNAYARRTHLDVLLQRSGESLDQYRHRILGAILASGAAAQILASQVTPPWTRWTLDEAILTGRFFAAHVGEADRDVVHRLLKRAVDELLWTEIISSRDHPQGFPATGTDGGGSR